MSRCITFRAQPLSLYLRDIYCNILRQILLKHFMKNFERSNFDFKNPLGRAQTHLIQHLRPSCGQELVILILFGLEEAPFVSRQWCLPPNTSADIHPTQKFLSSQTKAQELIIISQFVNWTKRWFTWNKRPFNYKGPSEKLHIKRSISHFWSWFSNRESVRG